MEHTNLKAIALSVDGIIFNINQLVKTNLIQLASNINVNVPEAFFDIYLEGGYEQKHRAKIHYHLLEAHLDEFGEKIRHLLLTAAQQAQLPLVEGIQQLLHFINQHHLKVGLVSSYSRELTLKMLESFPYELKYDALVCDNEVLEGKPEANIYQKLLVKLNVSCDEILSLETTVNGVCASYLANIETYFVEIFQLRKERSQKFSNRQLTSLSKAIELI